MTVDPDPQLQRQILRELSFLKTCESPYIVAFYGAFLEETTVSICMEYCEGGSLEDIYKRANELQGVIGETILANVAEAVSSFFRWKKKKKITCNKGVSRINLLAFTTRHSSRCQTVQHIDNKAGKNQAM